MKRTLWTLSLAAAAGLMLTSCTTGAEPTPTTSPSASPSPTVSASPSTAPQSTADPSMDGQDGQMKDMLPGMDAMPEAAGVTTVTDARKAVEQLEDELEKLSEVDDAQVVLIGNTAAIALEFDDQYQGGVDDRLREIVKERVDGVISGVSVIEITDDAGLMDELEKLGDRLDGAADMDDLRTELDKLIQRITGGSAA